MQTGQKNLAHQCITPYVEGYELPKVLDVVEQVVRSVVHHELWHYETSRQLVVNNMGAKRYGEHVI